MSAKLPVWSWTDAVAGADIAPLTKFVCLNIARYFSSAGKGWRVSIKEMMADTGLSNRSLATHLKLAADAKLLIVKREAGPHGQRGVTTYVPRFPDGTELAREAELPPSEPSSRGQSEPPSSRPREPRSRQVSFQEKSSQDQRSSELPSDDRQSRPAALPRFVSEAALDKVKALAPGWDRQALLRKYLEWPGSKAARNMDAAFLAWVPKFTKGAQPS